MLRFACALVIAAELVLLYLFVAPSGSSAIVFSFAGNPLLVAGIALALAWLVRMRNGNRKGS